MVYSIYVIYIRCGCGLGLVCIYIYIYIYLYIFIDIHIYNPVYVSVQIIDRHFGESRHMEGFWPFKLDSFVPEEINIRFVDY